MLIAFPYYNGPVAIKLLHTEILTCMSMKGLLLLNKFKVMLCKILFSVLLRKMCFTALKSYVVDHVD